MAVFSYNKFLMFCSNENGRGHPHKFEFSLEPFNIAILAYLICRFFYLVRLLHRPYLRILPTIFEAAPCIILILIGYNSM